MTEIPDIEARREALRLQLVEAREAGDWGLAFKTMRELETLSHTLETREA